MKASLLLAGGLAAVPSVAAGQAIGGRVVDATTQQPVARVSVVVRVDTQLVRVETFRDGTFTLALPRAGRFRLELSPDAGAPFVTDSLDVGPDAFVQREFAVTPRPDPVYLAFHVDSVAVFRPGNRGPRDPADMRRRQIEGEVVARYVVDTTGRVRAGSFEAVRTTDPAFAASVAAALRETRFFPAVREGRKVPQLVQHAVLFKLRGEMANIIVVPPETSRQP